MSTCLNRTLRACLAGLALFLVSSSIQAHAQARTLPTNTRFYVPPPAAGAEPQAISLLLQGQWKNALLIAGMELTPQAVWLTSGTPADVGAQVQTIVQGAAGQGAVPVMVLYNIPGRDCGSYSAGGAENTAAYQAWIDAIAQQLGNSKAVLIVEPDAIANLPSDCGYPTTVDATQLTADRYTQINYAVQTFGAHAPNALVYLDGGNSNWQAVGIIASRLMTAGLAKAQGFFTNVSNFRESTYEAKFDTWVSECVAFANNPADGGWRLSNYSYCASQYYSPNGPVNPNDISTWTYTDQWYAANLGSAVPSTHFVFDTSRNGQGPLNTAVYASAPYNQPAAVVTTITGGTWCNPPGAGLGYRPTANTGYPLLDAILWVKTPGQSDGTCDAQGGARAWNFSDYTQAGWPSTAAAQATFDPLWGLNDPNAGAWFPQQALQLAQRANPPLSF